MLGRRLKKGRHEALGAARMDQNDAEKRLPEASPDEDRREENKGNQEIPGESAPSPRLDRFKLARHLTEKAIKGLKASQMYPRSQVGEDLFKDKKIFSIYGHYPVIRNTLRRKGWVEKKFNFLSKIVSSGEDECEESKYIDIEDDNEMIFQKSNNIHDVMSRLVKTEIPYFLWTIKRDVVDYHNLSCEQMLNHYGKTASFTTKIGLCMNMRNLPWYVPANPHSFFPRCYGLCSDGEKQEFLEDFRRTAASSILKWVVSHHSYSKSKSRVKKEDNDEEMGQNRDQANSDEKKLIDLPGELIEVACKVCENYLGQLEHEDIDISAESLITLSDAEWKELIEQYYNLIHGYACIPNSKSYFYQCQSILNKITSANPQFEIDGMRNIWILKPGAKSRGRDIICMDKVEEIMKLVTSDNIPSKDNKWVVQKYIETPLLIYDTKFDIRQWFLVTDWNPLTIWFYKESYLRFSTQRFSLDSLDSAIHLCNNSIQKHFKNAKDRSPLLPCYNMWTSTKFQEYLQKRGRGHVWHNIIYPSMKKAITHTMKVAQDHVEARKNSFELYGADFILGKDFKPWLIEINSSPTMFPSTPVTAQLCAQVQEDTIKVVVDRKTDRNCDIGNFELLWRQPAVELPPFTGTNLFVEGFSIQKGRRHMTPISNISLGNPLPAGHLLRSRCFSSQEDQLPEQTTALKPDLKSREDKGPSCILPVPFKRGSGRTYKISSIYTKTLSNVEFPPFSIQHLEDISHKSVFPRAKATKLTDPNMLSSTSIASVLQSIRSLESPVFQPPKGPGSKHHPTFLKLSPQPCRMPVSPLHDYREGCLPSTVTHRPEMIMEVKDLRSNLEDQLSGTGGPRTLIGPEGGDADSPSALPTAPTACLS
ncbi:protein monoglycylase TTLL8 isoform X2 [Macrotis lagotis]|uniref:protein monoglycylase TTLL8 isoform X2 n=1 Tax=Macrotis lagotis TaxID=92651 RepID=UPI003D683EA1